MKKGVIRIDRTAFFYLQVEKKVDVQGVGILVNVARCDRIRQYFWDEGLGWVVELKDECDEVAIINELCSFMKLLGEIRHDGIIWGK